MNTVPSYIVLEKKIGQTPLDAIQEWRKANSEHKDVPATYAGRLDPMASGKLLVLLGDECKKREEYIGLDKEYEIEVVFGIRTDTGDALGLPEMTGESPPIRTKLLQACRNMLGTHTVLYPAFSSKTVNGTPLFQYALEGRLDEIDIPTHVERIYAIRLSDFSFLSGSDLLRKIQKHLSFVPRTGDPSKRIGADFRQDEIRKAWIESLQGYENAMFGIARLKVVCASGTYMRTLAERIGKELGTTAFALSIHRSRIGRYRSFGPFGFWSRTY